MPQRWTHGEVVLAQRTSFRVGGIARRTMTVACRADDVAAAASSLTQPPDFVLGGGTNVLAADTGFGGLLLRYDDRSTIEDLSAGRYRCSANTPLEVVVARVGADGWAGVEQLAGIPGSVGGAVVQNAGAYDHCIEQVLESVMAVDLTTADQAVFTMEQCELGYRDSVFKRLPHRWAITGVTVRLLPEPAPVRSQQIAERLNGAAVDVQHVSRIVREVRGGKDHLLGPGNPSAGSFFKNPRLLVGDDNIAAIDREFTHRRDALVRLGLMDPRTPKTASKALPGGVAVELVAGLLIGTAADATHRPGTYTAERTIGRLRLGRGGANTIINADGARASEVISLASGMRRAVLETYGVLLAPEVVLLGDIALEDP